MKRRRNEQGMVLISVLWVVFVLTLISFTLASAARVEVEATQQSFDSERAFFMAKGAAEVFFGLYSAKKDLPEDSPVRIENGEYIFPFDSGEARVKLESNAGKIDINAASDQLLASVFDSIGVNQELRNRLVDSILDWRDDDDIPHLYGAESGDYRRPSMSPGILQSIPRNGSFETIDELLSVKNMTPDIFYGSLAFDSAAQRYRKVPGVREILTVNSGEGVNPNEASVEVLSALPQMNSDSVAQVIEERERRPFSSKEDLMGRLPQLTENPAITYLRFDNPLPVALVSRAVMKKSGVSRTVRLLLTSEEKLQFISLVPLLYKKVRQVRMDRWRYE